MARVTPHPPPPPPADAGSPLPAGLRWFIALVVLAVGVSVAGVAYVLSVLAAIGCVGDCSDPDPRPLVAGVLVLGSAGMAGATAGVVPWALGRPDRIRRTALIVAAVVVLLFVASVLAN